MLVSHLQDFPPFPRSRIYSKPFLLTSTLQQPLFGRVWRFEKFLAFFWSISYISWFFVVLSYIYSHLWNFSLLPNKGCCIFCPNLLGPHRHFLSFHYPSTSQRWITEGIEINELSTMVVDEAGEDNKDVDWQPRWSTMKQYNEVTSGSGHVRATLLLHLE